jgi:gliding motility-associated-like protein
MVGRFTRAIGYSGSLINITSASYVCVIICILAFIDQTQAQGTANKWYFGSGAGLDFSSGTPVSVTGAVNTYEGSASVSDATGNLLFYTDGVNIWNRNHQLMQNGTNLLGDFSTTQAALIIRKPSSSNTYFVFTADNQCGPDGLRYSEVDMSLNNGLGDVTANKNIFLQDSTTERITAVKHCNGRDIWVIAHDFGSNQFRSYLVTSAGVNTTPVTSAAGSVYGASVLNASSVGYMKASPTGKKLAIANYGQDYFELFDFNSTTGTVSNAMQFNNFTDAYGVEFSSDGKKLYVTGVFLPNIYQYDVFAGNQAAIAASATIVGQSNTPGTLQIGPGGKIYIVQYMSNMMDVINNPNATGMACGFAANAITLTASSGQIGLPNFPPYEFAAAAPQALLNSNVDCLNASFTCSVQNSSAITSVAWNFNDPASGASNSSTALNATHTFTAPGSYNVQLIINYTCSSDTVYYPLDIPDCALKIEITGGNFCPGSCFTFNAHVEGGRAPYTYTWSEGGAGDASHTVCPEGTTIYTLVVTDSDSTVVSDTAVVKMLPKPAATFSATCNTSAQFSNEVTFCDHTQGAAAWQWSFGDNHGHSTAKAPEYSYPNTGTFTVTLVVANEYGCTDTAQKVVDIEPRFSIYVPSAFTPNGDGLNDQFFPQGYNMDEGDFKMMIYNRWGQLIYETASEPWDGRMEGSADIAQQDVYVWKIITRDTQKRYYEYTGHVNLLR